MTKTDFFSWAYVQSWTQTYKNITKQTEEQIKADFDSWFNLVVEFTKESEDFVAHNMRYLTEESYKQFSVLEGGGLSDEVLNKYYNEDLKLFYSFRGVCDELSLIHDKVVNEVVQLNPKSVLDFGGGNGRLILKISENLPNTNTVYTDIDKLGVSFINFLKEKYKLENLNTFYNVENSLLALTDSYDCIVSLDVLEHFLDPGTAIKHLCQHINPGGHFIALINCHSGADHPTSTATKYGGEAREDSLVSSSGFTLIKNIRNKVKLWRKK